PPAGRNPWRPSPRPAPPPAAATSVAAQTTPPPAPPPPPPPPPPTAHAPRTHLDVQGRPSRRSPVTVATRFLVPLVVAASTVVISPAWGQAAGAPAPRP